MDGVWEKIKTAEWVANVGLPLATTILAVVVATVLVLRQMSHDRLLAMAQRRAEDARRLASEMVEIIERLNDPMRREKNWDRQEMGSSLSTLLHACDQARIPLGDLSPFFTDLRRAVLDLDAGWHECHVRRGELYDEQLLRPNTVYVWEFDENSWAHFDAEQWSLVALGVALAPLVEPLRRAAHALYEWDGYSSSLNKVRWPAHAPTAEELMRSGRGRRRRAFSRGMSPYHQWILPHVERYEKMLRSAQAHGGGGSAGGATQAPPLHTAED